jgi:acyl-CoA thioester hydrolase
MNDEQRPPTHRFVTRLRVRNYEMDAFGHVNNAVYLHYLEQAAWEHSEYLGVTWRDYEQLGGIFILRKMEVEYLRPSVAGDILEVSTWAHELRGARAVRRYEIVNADSGTLLVQATGVWAWIERATGRPRPLPAMIHERFIRPVHPDAGWQER